MEKFKARPIAHNLFKNVSLEECVALLEKSDMGTAMFRPSGHSNTTFNLSWRCSKEPFAVKHESIEERTSANEQKAAGDYSLGAKLFMDTVEYSDLDEIVALHVEPQAMFIREVCFSFPRITYYLKTTKT